MPVKVKPARKPSVTALTQSFEKLNLPVVKITHEKVNCDCGATIVKSNMSRHLRSQKHLKKHPVAEPVVEPVEPVVENPIINDMPVSDPIDIPAPKKSKRKPIRARNVSDK
jgi:hypothetical protein